MKRKDKIIITLVVIAFVLIISMIVVFSRGPGEKPAVKESIETTAPVETVEETAVEEPSTPTPVPEPAPAPVPITSGEDSLEYKCAVINNGGPVSLSDPLVANFKYVLDSLQSKYPSYTREQISDIICMAKERIDTTTTAKKSLLEIAHGINNGITAEVAQSITLEEEAALYVGLVRQSGQ